MAIIAFLPLYFPNGRLVSRRWRPVAWLAVFVTVFLTAFAMVRPAGDETRGIRNPLGIESLEGYEAISGAFGIFLPTSWVVIGLLSVASLVVRFRRSRGEERQQLKWFVYAAVLLTSWTIVAQLLPVRVPIAASEILFIVTLQGLWIALAVAILRYRLYDIDRIINRTLVYASLTAMLALVYFGGVTATQAILGALTGQEDLPQFAIVASTLAIAALFGPLRHRVQGLIDRRFYRQKYDAAKTLAAFSAKLRDETDLDALGADLVSVVGETMQPSHASLWLRTPKVDRGATG